jgi:glycosyltransferase involved in cell wall biosynthesis
VQESYPVDRESGTDAPGRQAGAVVLMVASTLPRWPGDAIPDFVLAQARALRRAHPGLVIHLLAPHDAGAALDEEIDGITIHRFRYAWPPSAQRLVYPAILPNLRRRPGLVLQVPLLFIAEFAAVLDFCRRHRPAVLYSHWFAPQGIVCGIVALITGIPHVLTSHSSDVAVMRRLPLLGPALVRFFVRRLQACTVVSRRTREKLLAFFPDPLERARIEAKTLTLPMGVDTTALGATTIADREACRDPFGFSGRIVFLFLGRLTAKKGLDVLLDAFAQLATRREAALLVIAGDGEERAAVSRRVSALGLDDRVRLPGFVTGEDKRRLLAAADGLVLPSRIMADGDAEGLPVALLEGLAAGLLCVASDASGADDVLTDGVDGFIVPQQDVAALAAALLRVHDLASAERSAVGARARARARAFDWATVADAHYRHLLAPAIDAAGGTRPA